MESNLNCLAQNCAFNKFGNCYASHIKIEGFDATVTPETYCDSFRNNSAFSISNYSGDVGLTNTQCISCSATNCTYNVNGGCSSPSVEINFENATCETFKMK